MDPPFQSSGRRAFLVTEQGVDSVEDGREELVRAVFEELIGDPIVSRRFSPGQLCDSVFEVLQGDFSSKGLVCFRRDLRNCVCVKWEFLVFGCVYFSLNKDAASGTEVADLARRDCN